MLFGFISGNFTLFNFFLSTDHVFFRIFAENYLITVILHMNRTTTFVSSFLFVVLASLFAGTAQAQDRLYTDEFPLGDVTLLDGPLKRARDLNISVLMKYDNDRLLAP